MVELALVDASDADSVGLHEDVRRVGAALLRHAATLAVALLPCVQELAPECLRESVLCSKQAGSNGGRDHQSM